MQKITFLLPDPLAGAATKNQDFDVPRGRFWSFFFSKNLQGPYKHVFK
jgi:hypothetical protein